MQTIFLLTDRKSTSRMTKWSDMEIVMAAISHLLYHGGITSSDWFSEMLHNIKTNFH